MIKWREKHQECNEKDLMLNHKRLYRTLVQKNNNQRTWVQEEVWQRIQDKSLSNGCKDFKWLLIHKKLLVRSIMHAHRYQATKNCLRIKCQREETIEHIMRECFFCKGGVGGNAEAARLYKKNFV